MKCVILLLCVAAAHGLIMPMGAGMYSGMMRGTAFSLRTGMPMSFLRKKRDIMDSKKSVAIHVANHGLARIPIAYSGFASPYIFRKKRDADQQADSSAWVSSPLTYGGLGLGLGYGYGYGYSTLGNPLWIRK